jgi:hypothetical protein
MPIKPMGHMKIESPMFVEQCDRQVTPGGLTIIRGVIRTVNMRRCSRAEFARLRQPPRYRTQSARLDALRSMD